MPSLVLNFNLFLILCVVIIMFIAGSISALIWRKKLKVRLFPILGIMLVSPIMVLIVLVTIFITGVTLFDNFGSGYSSVDPKELSVNCPKLGKITAHIAYSGDKPYYYNIIQYLKKNDGQTFLLNEYQSGWGGNNSQIFDKYQDKNSTLGHFPKNELLRQGFDFVPSMNKYENSGILKRDPETISREDRDVIENTDEAVFIHPSKMSKQEFKALAECVSNSQQGKLEPASEYKFTHQKQINYLFNTRIFVYGEPFLINRDVYLNKYQCENSQYSIYIAPSGVLKLLSEAKESDSATIGFVDKQGKIDRENDYTKAVSYFYGKKQGFLGFNHSYYFNTSTLSFTEAYQGSQTLKLLFNENQEPIDDYLKTCKNTEGKTVFDLFKVD